MTPPTLKSTLHLYALNLQSLFISELYLPPPAAVLFVIHNQDNIFLFIFSILLPFWASLVSRSFFSFHPVIFNFYAPCPANFAQLIFITFFISFHAFFDPPADFLRRFLSVSTLCSATFRIRATSSCSRCRWIFRENLHAKYPWRPPHSKRPWCPAKWRWLVSEK